MLFHRFFVKSYSASLPNRWGHRSPNCVAGVIALLVLSSCRCRTHKCCADAGTVSYKSEKKTIFARVVTVFEHNLCFTTWKISYQISYKHENVLGRQQAIQRCYIYYQDRETGHEDMSCIQERETGHEDMLCSHDRRQVIITYYALTTGDMSWWSVVQSRQGICHDDLLCSHDRGQFMMTCYAIKTGRQVMKTCDAFKTGIRVMKTFYVVKTGQYREPGHE